MFGRPSYFRFVSDFASFLLRVNPKNVGIFGPRVLIELFVAGRPLFHDSPPSLLWARVCPGALLLDALHSPSKILMQIAKITALAI